MSRYPTPKGDGLGPLISELADLRQRVTELEGPSGTSRYGVRSQAGQTANGLARTVNYLESLTTDVVVGGNFSQTVANDALFHWYSAAAPIPQLLAYPVSTGRALVTVTAGEVQINPLGGFVQALVGYTVKDSTGATVPGGALATAQRYGRVFAGQEFNIGIRTPEVPIDLDPVANPGPYDFTAFFGAWVRADNSGPCGFIFNDLSLRVDVLSNGPIA